MRYLKRLILFCLWIFAGLFVFSLLFLLVSLIVVLHHGGNEESASLGTIKTDHAVGLVDLKGEILSSDTFRKLLKKVMKEDKIKAVVVRIDSPGGSVGAAEEIYRAIKEADAKKPVVCSLGNVAASGGIYAAVACRKIVANSGTLTGSIGVVLLMPGFEALMDRFGLQMNVVKSGKFKDTGSPFRKMESDERALLQNIVDLSYEQFVRTVAESRHLDPAVVRGFADGRLLVGEDALKKGLVDELGGPERAAKIALELAGDTAEPEIITVKKPTGLAALLASWSESETMTWLNTLGHARLLYQSFF